MGLMSLGAALGPVRRKLLLAEASFWYQEAKANGPSWWQQKKQSLIVEYGQQRVDELVKEMENLRNQLKNQKD